MNGDGIIGRAKNARDKYQSEQDKEQDTISQYEYELAKAAGTTTAGSVDEYVLETVYNAKIGDYVRYDPATDAKDSSYTSNADKTGHESDQVFNLSDYNSTWQVLGVENGKLKLISTSLVPLSVNNNTTNYYTLKGKAGYKNSIDELDSISKLYGQGKFAKTARSVNLKDLMQVSQEFTKDSRAVVDYDQAYIDIQFPGKPAIGEYGTEVTYCIEKVADEDKLVYRSSNGKTLTVDPKYFYHYDSETRTFLTYNDIKDNATQKKYKLTNNLLDYYPIRLYNSVQGELNYAGLKWFDLLYNKAYKIDDSTRKEVYFIATQRNYASPRGPVGYGIYHCKGQGVGASFLTNGQESGEPTESSLTFGVRPVIILEEGIKLQKHGDPISVKTPDQKNELYKLNVWDIIKK